MKNYKNILLGIVFALTIVLIGGNALFNPSQITKAEATPACKNIGDNCGNDGQCCSGNCHDNHCHSSTTTTSTSTTTTTTTTTTTQPQCKHEYANCDNASDHSCCEGLSCQWKHTSGWKCREEEEVTTTTTTTTTKPGECGHHHVCRENSCVKVDGEGSDDCKENEDCEEVTTTTTTEPVTTTTTTGPRYGLPGDGLSDGGSSCPDCTKAHNSTSTGASVLGASTGPAVLGLSTTSGEESAMLQLVQLFGALVSAGAGITFFKKNG
jgi:hypothetical protein